MSQPIQHQPIHPGAGVRPVEAFTETYGLVFRNLPTVGRLLLVPLGVVAAGSYWAFERQVAALQLLAETGQEPGFDTAQIIPVVFQLLAFVAFATAWHRWILMGPAGIVPGLGLAWRRVEWVYLLALVCLYVLTFAILASGSLIMVLLTATTESPALAIVLFALTLAVSIYVFCRFCLALPGAAVGAGTIVRTAQRRSYAKVFRIFLAFLLVFLPVVLLDLAVYLVMFPGDMDVLVQSSDEFVSLMQGMRIPFLLSGVILYGLTAALFVALLSVLYRQLTGYGQSGERSGEPD